MRAKEFKETFKVGDIITCEFWNWTPCIITALGEFKFIAKNIGTGLEDIEAYDFVEWSKVKQEQKPSEEIRTKGNPLGSACSLSHSILDWLDENWPKVVKK